MPDAPGVKAITRDDETTALTEGPAPEARDGFVAVRPRLVGLDPIDLEAARGKTGFHGVLGHRFVAETEDGSRVVADPDLPCGSCELCTRGLSAHCRARRTMGLIGLDGALAERALAPERGLLRIPDEVPDEAAVFALLIARAHHVKDVIRLEAKTYITVLGDSPLALLTTQVLARLNASVRLVGRDPARGAMCERWGVKSRPLADVGRRQDQDVVVDCTGSADGVAQAVEMVRPRGTFLIPEPAAPTAAGADLRAVVAHEITLTGVRGFRLDEAVRDLAERRVDTTGLITARTSLGDGLSALRPAADPANVSVIVKVA